MNKGKIIRIVILYLILSMIFRMFVGKKPAEVQKPANQGIELKVDGQKSNGDKLELPKLKPDTNIAPKLENSLPKLQPDTPAQTTNEMPKLQADQPQGQQNGEIKLKLNN